MKNWLILTCSVLSLSAAASFPLDFSENFEELTIGTIHEQNGWTIIGDGTADVQSEMAVNTNGLQIQSGTVTRTLSSSNSSIWVSFHAFITAAPATNPVVNNPSTSVAFFVNTNRNLVVLNGTNATVLSTQMPTNTWVRFDIYCDYAAKKWTLGVNSNNVTAEALDLFSSGSTIESILIANGSSSPVYFDELAVKDTEPENEVMIDTDSDGIPDWWELRYTDSITAADTNQLAANGLTYLQAYIAGLLPDVADDMLTITRENGRILGWERKPGRTYEIWWSTNLVSGFNDYFQVASEGNEFEVPESVEAALFYQIRVRKE
jgi:hypothetical protein